MEHVEVLLLQEQPITRMGEEGKGSKVGTVV
jgi:hypothetical protein